MALSPEDITSRKFTITRRGYDTDEVDTFLGFVAREVHNLQAGSRPQQPLPERRPQHQTPGPPAPDPPTQGRGAPQQPPGPSAPAQPAPAQAPAQPPQAGGDDFERLGSEVASVLRTAHESVDKLRADAEQAAGALRQRAEKDAAELRAVTARECEELQARASAEAERLRSEAATYAVETRRQADEKLDSAAHQVVDAEERSEALMAETKARAAAVRDEAQQQAASVLATAEAKARETTEQAEAHAQARKNELLGYARSRLDSAAQAERVTFERLAATVTELEELLARLRSQPRIDVEIDLEEGTVIVPDQPAEAPGAAGPTPRPRIVDDDIEAQRSDDDPLAQLVKRAVGKAVQNAVSRSQPHGAEALPPGPNQT